MNRSVVLCVVGMLLLFGCSATKEQIKPEIPSSQEVSAQDKQTALQYFIDGSLKESKGQYAEAILDYQEALRYDKNAAIFYSLSKNYSQLRRHALAAENAREAVKLDSENLEYRQTLAGIYITSGQFNEAAKEYSEIVRRDSGNVNALYALAQLTERTRPMQALQLYQKILDRSGPSWEVLLQVAQLNSILQRFDAAANAFEQMTKLDPSNSALKQNLAETYVRAGKPEKAQEILSDLLEKNPDNVELNISSAELFLQQNDWKNAEPYLLKILKNDSLDADTRFRIGIAYYSQALKDSLLLPKTLELFKNFSKAFPNDWRALLYTGVLYRTTKNDSSAREYLTKATQIASKNPEAWWQLGWLHFDRQNFNEAVEVMEKARQYIPDDFRVHLLLGIVYSRAQRNQEARVALERAVELNPADLNALSSLGLTYDALKMHAESDSVYERALRIDSDYALVLNNYAYSLSERKIQLDRAEKMSRRSLEKDSLNSSYLDTFGWILYQRGKYSEALVYIQKAVNLGDANPVVLEHLGDVYAKLNQTENARKYWNLALEKDQNNAALKEKISKGKP